MAIRPQMRFDVDDDLYRLVDACRVDKGEKSISDTCRRLLKEAAGREMLENGLDTLNPQLRKLIKDEFRVSENRVAKITAKTANATATTMYMCYQVLKSLGVKDMPDIYDVARKKGVAFVKIPYDEMLIDDNQSNSSDIL